MKEQKITIDDLYVSDDFLDGFKKGKTIQNVTLQIDKPITLDAHTWFYVEYDYIIIIHEIYNNDAYIRTDTIRLPKKLLF